MNKFQTLRGRNWAQFDEFQLDLTQRGATFIRGRNDDAGGNANGAGKSSLVNSLYATLFGNHQLAVRKKSLSSIVTSETSMGVSVRTGEHDLRALMRGTDFRLRIDGEPVEARSSRRGDEREVMLSKMRLTPELYSAAVHINGVAGSPILRGTSAQRCQFLERAFDLDRWSERHAAVGDALAQMKRADSDLQEARSDLEALGKAEALGELRKDLAALVGREGSLRSKASTLSARASRAESMPERPRRSSSQLRADIAALEGSLDGAADAREMADWREARRRRDAAVEEVSRLRSELGDYEEEQDVSALAEQSESARAALAAAEDAVRHERAVRAWRSAASEVAARHGMAFRDLRHLRSMSESWVANLRSGSDECPVCGGALRTRVAGEQLDRVEALLRDLPERLPVENLRQPDVDTLRVRARRARSRLDRAEAAASTLDAIKSAQRAAVAELPPKPRGEVLDVAKSARDLADLRRLLAAATAWEGVEETDVPALRRRLAEVEGDLERTREEIVRARDSISRAEEREVRRARLTSRVEELSREVTLRPIYRALQQAYSPNGMRLWVLQELVESLVQGMNSGSHSSRDRMVFGYKLSRNRDLLLTASNVRGTFDIRMLSGAESAFFVLNFLSVVLPMLPASRRSSVLILDEIDGQCSAQSRAVMADEYLPRLCEIVPCVYVVTPSTPAMFSSRGCREALVVKRGGKSVLHQE